MDEVKMKLEVLLSCMNQYDKNIVDLSKITSNVVVINQCDRESIERYTEDHIVKIINTKERGLSKSRNMGIAMATEEICLLCDDDEEFEIGYEELIISEFDKLQDADIIIFDVKGAKKSKLSSKVQKIGYLDSLKVSSCQISFRRTSIVENNIYFDEKLGAGTPSGCGEENKFLWDCLKSGLTIYYVPKTIAAMRESTSTWFQGYNKKFFENRGMVTRYIMGFWMATLYGIYYILTKRRMYGNEISSVRAAFFLAKGIMKNSLHKDYNSLHE